MKKASYIFLIINLFFSKSIFAQGDNSESESSKEGFAIGINFDPAYLAPGVKMGYRIGDYMGMHGILQYSVSDNAQNIMAEKLHAKQEAIDLWSNYSYKNLFSSLVLDIYPLSSGAKVSFGVGYMDKNFTNKKSNDKLVNANKFVGVASIGYEGSLLDGNSLRYDVEVGIKFLDITLNSEVIKSKESQWKMVPAVNIGLTYSF
jgi:hypothetical protein